MQQARRVPGSENSRQGGQSGPQAVLLVRPVRAVVLAVADQLPGHLVLAILAGVHLLRAALLAQLLVLAVQTLCNSVAPLHRRHALVALAAQEIVRGTG